MCHYFAVQEEGSFADVGFLQDAASIVHVEGGLIDQIFPRCLIAVFGLDSKHSLEKSCTHAVTTACRQVRLYFVAHCDSVVALQVVFTTCVCNACLHFGRASRLAELAKQCDERRELKVIGHLKDHAAMSHSSSMVDISKTHM